MALFQLLLLLVTGFIVWQLWRLVRTARQANRVDWGSDWVNLLDGLNRLFCYRYHRLNVTGIRLPRSGAAIVVSNHLSGLDPMLLVASARRPLRFLIAREEYERFGLKWLFRAMGCIPVDRARRPEQALRVALRALGQGEIVALFPHGGIHLETHPPRRLKAGAARLAELTGSSIFPVRISGIRGAGGVVSGVLLRSRAQIELFSSLKSDGRTTMDLLDEIAGIIDYRPQHHDDIMGL
jgi:1-acyl-sn-glycerol-3-phosphate acyltransferase